MTQFHQYRSFLLRLWQESEADLSAVWRGEIESIQSGQTWRFDSFPALFELVQSVVLKIATYED